MAIERLGVVTETAPLGPGLVSLTLRCPQIAIQALPGQFLHLACGEGNLLRRPISICRADEDCLVVIFQIKGEGTRWLSQRRVGDSVSILGPLGHGFDLDRAGERPVFIGGGIGVPPLLYAMEQARQSGARPQAILGFRSRDMVILETEFAALGPCTVTTDDGSYGQKGFVSDVLAGLGDKPSCVCACGPKPMLRAVAQLALEQGIPCQVSLEERMGCGLGACLVCACQLAAENGEMRYGHVCKDGPVFDAKEVLW